LTYSEFLTNLNSNISNQSFNQYATSYGIPVVYNPETQSLIVNNTPVNMANSGLQLQDNQLYGSEDAYNDMLRPFLGTQQGVGQQIMSQQAHQTPDYIKQFMQEMFERQQQPFSYDFEDDPLVALAREQVESSMAEMAAKRGFLFGSAERDIVGAQMQGLYQQFEDAAYAKEQDFLNRQMKLAGVVMQWDTMQAERKMQASELLNTKAEFIMKLQRRDLDVFKMMLNQRRFEMEMLLDEQRLEMAKKDADLNNAYRKMETLGYADKEVALLLGIPQGTRAQWVQKLMAQKSNDLATMKQKHANDMAMLALNKKIEKELLAEKDRLHVASSLRLMKDEYAYKSALAEVSERHRRILQAKAEAEARAKAEAAERARAAESERRAREKAEKASLDEMYKVEYNRTLNQFKYRFVKNSIVPDSKLKAASEWLFNEYADGKISKETFNRIKATYGLPTYEPSLREQFGLPRMNVPAGQNVFTQEGLDAMQVYRSLSTQFPYTSVGGSGSGGSGASAGYPYRFGG
jgi:hypothetical protein